MDKVYGHFLLMFMSKLVQVMAWCCQATSHYPSQCRPRLVLPNGVKRLYCVHIINYNTILHTVQQMA